MQFIVTEISAACWVYLANGNMQAFFNTSPDAKRPGALGCYMFAACWMG